MILRGISKKKSGKRDSNPRPLPWQGNALPAELFPRFMLIKVAYSLIMSILKSIIFHIFNYFFSVAC